MWNLFEELKKTIKISLLNYYLFVQFGKCNLMKNNIFICILFCVYVSFICLSFVFWFCDIEFLYFLHILTYVKRSKLIRNEIEANEIEMKCSWLLLLETEMILPVCPCSIHVLLIRRKWFCVFLFLDWFDLKCTHGCDQPENIPFRVLRSIHRYTWWLEWLMFRDENSNQIDVKETKRI